MATRSLWRAFELLGFPSSHHPVEFCEMYAENRIEDSWLTRLDHYAAGDIPIPCMFRKLYKLFPEARFVAVFRPFDKWFASLKKHLKHSGIPDSATVEHTLLYGYPITADDCDEDLCRKVFVRHETDMVDFFRDKGHFLPLWIDRLNWDELCQFLELPVPDVPFPRIGG